MSMKMVDICLPPQCASLHCTVLNASNLKLISCFEELATYSHFKNIFDVALLIMSRFHHSNSERKNGYIALQTAMPSKSRCNYQTALMTLVGGFCIVGGMICAALSTDIYHEKLRGNLIGGREREMVIFGHLHIAKTAGTTINGKLAFDFERVCGHKGYSYDAYGANERHKKAGGGDNEIVNDSFTKLYAEHNRLRVNLNIMNEIGFEDCDWISHEIEWEFWPDLVSKFQPHNLSVELHVPCREPLDHLMSMVNYSGERFNCTATNLQQEVHRMILRPRRFSKKLEEVDGLTLRCFNPMPPQRYIEYMEDILQRKRIGGEFVHRSTNSKRNKSNECIWSKENEKVKEQVRGVMQKIDYFSWCTECLDSDRNLFKVA